MSGNKRKEGGTITKTTCVHLPHHLQVRAMRCKNPESCQGQHHCPGSVKENSRASADPLSEGCVKQAFLVKATFAWSDTAQSTLHTLMIMGHMRIHLTVIHRNCFFPVLICVKRLANYNLGLSCIIFLLANRPKQCIRQCLRALVLGRDTMIIAVFIMDNI